MLHIHNSLSGQKELFTPLRPPHVGVYVCGMTVYDYCHIGHARVMVVFDVVVRHLRALGYDVNYVRNITDIDDKIIRRAIENGETMASLTARFIAAMHEDATALGVLPPDHEPRATDSLSDIIALIERLISQGHAYCGANHDVYYEVASFPAYGRLSGKRLEDLRAGARVEVDEDKRSPLDFVLWKAAKADEPSWPSPWGPGRPGWHIECSAMSMRCLGSHFDLHGGGMDLKFPHHENEIAQSEGATGQRFVNVWMHNGFVQVDDEKMSKSLGNFFTIREVLAHYPAEAVRYFILSSHYRGPLNYSPVHLDQARTALERLYMSMRGLPAATAADPDNHGARLQAAMNDDFNTPEALAVLFDLSRAVNRARAEGNLVYAAALATTLRTLAAPLGLLQQNPDLYLRGIASQGLPDAEIEALIKQRTAARAGKNWAESDRLRDALHVQGVILEDGPHGTVWRRIQ